MKHPYSYLMPTFAVLVLFLSGKALAQAPDFAWIKQGGGTSNDIGYYIAVDDSGNSYVTGNFKGTATFGNTSLISSGVEDIFVAKYDAAGSVLWAKQAGGTSSEIGFGIAVDNSGNSYVTGNFTGSATFDSTTLVSSGSTDIFIAKYDASGTVLWVKQAGGTSDDVGFDIAVDGTGNSYMTGYFVGSATFGSTTLVSSGGSDIFIAKINAAPITSVLPIINCQDTALLTAEAFPNPFEFELVVHLNSHSSALITITLMDVLGRVIEQRNATPGEWKLNTSQLNPGIYLLTIKQDGVSRQLKVMKAH